MGLADALDRRAGEAVYAGPKLVRIIGELGEPDRVALLAALRSQLPHRAIWRALNDEGFECSEKAVSSWREANGWVSQNA